MVIYSEQRRMKTSAESVFSDHEAKGFCQRGQRDAEEITVVGLKVSVLRNEIDVVSSSWIEFAHPL